MASAPRNPPHTAPLPVASDQGRKVVCGCQQRVQELPRAVGRRHHWADVTVPAVRAWCQTPRLERAGEAVQVAAIPPGVTQVGSKGLWERSRGLGCGPGAQRPQTQAVCPARAPRTYPEPPAAPRTGVTSNVLQGPGKGQVSLSLQPPVSCGPLSVPPSLMTPQSHSKPRACSSTHFAHRAAHYYHPGGSHNRND